jgi:hypothetical protein
MNYLKPKQTLHGFKLPNAELLAAQQVSSILNCTESHVYHLLELKALDGIDVAPESNRSLWRVPRSRFMAFIRARSTGPSMLDQPISGTVEGVSIPDENVLVPVQVAAFLRCTPDHLYKLIANRQLCATNISTRGKGTYRITRAGLIHFLATRQEGAF